MRDFPAILAKLILVVAMLVLFSCPTPVPNQGVLITQPDLYPSSRVSLMYTPDGGTNWYQDDSFYPGETVRIYFKYSNIGVAAANQSFTIKFYLSTDAVISTEEDTELYTSTATRTLAAGLNPVSDNSYYTTASFSLPGDCAPGIYYIGCILDTGNTIVEFSEDNNATAPSLSRRVFIKDSDANGAGAFKFVNSWGTNGSWEEKEGGWYWVTYQTMKTLNMQIYFYDSDFSVQYRPTVIAVFQVTHPVRNACLIKFYLGDPSNPYVVKEFQSRNGTALQSGALPFPGNRMALDISEFAHLINYYDLKFSVTTAAGAAAGTVNSFEVRYYSVYSGNHIKTVTGGSGGFDGNGVATVFTAATFGALQPELLDDITPPLRSADVEGPVFVMDQPDDAELARDMAVIGIREPGKNYNRISDNGYGTGYAPPTLEEWRQMRKLRSVQTGVYGATGTDGEIDHSGPQYFPPIGSQGGEGSCACWAAAYYTHTFTMAKKFGWNLTGTTYGGAGSGAPQSNTDKIMSPDFIYHQINGGEDEGSSLTAAFWMLSNMGGASWQAMPYSDSDHTSWPGEAAFLQATNYRGRENFRLDGNNRLGYFIIYDDSDINLLKQLLLNGYIVTTAIDAGTEASPVTLFDFWAEGEQDVIDIGSLPAGYTPDHAQTIVGFKDGSVWHPATPDD